jgi:hypothetical protein
MKKIIFALVSLMFVVSCSKAQMLSMEKNNQSARTGIKRTITVYSSYTGQPVFKTTIQHSYFTGTSSNGTDIDILDLDNKMKTSIIGNNAIVIIEEID